MWNLENTFDLFSVHNFWLLSFKLNILCYLPLETLEFPANCMTFRVACIKRSLYVHCFFKSTFTVNDETFSVILSIPEYSCPSGLF